MVSLFGAQKEHLLQYQSPADSTREMKRDNMILTQLQPLENKADF